jgi:hypothetical protein
MPKHKAGGMPPTELPPLPTEDMEAEYRRFQRGVMKAYAVAIVMVITAIAYFS